jgi:hypothetical protein
MARSGITAIDDQLVHLLESRRPGRAGGFPPALNIGW